MKKYLKIRVLCVKLCSLKRADIICSYVLRKILLNVFYKLFLRNIIIFSLLCEHFHTSFDNSTNVFKEFNLKTYICRLSNINRKYKCIKRNVNLVILVCNTFLN